MLSCAVSAIAKVESSKGLFVVTVTGRYICEVGFVSTGTGNRLFGHCRLGEGALSGTEALGLE